VNHKIVSKMFETYGKDMAAVLKLDPHRVVTLVDAEGKDIFLTGVHYVNRIGYYVIDPPWVEEGEIEFD
jgi:hypothetical protein